MWSGHERWTPKTYKKLEKRLISCENSRFYWSEWGDSNSRHLEPKSSALPTGPHPDMKLENFREVVKHVVKSHFRPQILKSQGRKVIEPQRFFGLRIFPGTSGRSAPKLGAVRTLASG